MKVSVLALLLLASAAVQCYAATAAARGAEDPCPNFFEKPSGFLPINRLGQHPLSDAQVSAILHAQEQCVEAARNKFAVDVAYDKKLTTGHVDKDAEIRAMDTAFLCARSKCFEFGEAYFYHHEIAQKMLRLPARLAQCSANIKMMAGFELPDALFEKAHKPADYAAACQMMKALSFWHKDCDVLSLDTKKLLKKKVEEHKPTYVQKCMAKNFCPSVRIPELKVYCEAVVKAAGW
uniref:Predicted protein n=1 Tax=Hordeum vulgare subsp. vulgare TaxID=112509 RepID=F2DUZ7_HORVV|nr:predicted protein [Hordeum vulgare subsp. vulgare]